MKILLAHNRYQLPGGEDEVYRRELEMLVDHGHEVIEYTRDNREIAQYGVGDKATLAVRTTWAWDTHRQLGAILAKAKPDVAHFHNTFPLVSPAAYYACKAAGIPVVQTLHNYRLLCPAATFMRNSAPCEDCLDKSLVHSIRYGCYRQSRFSTVPVAAMLAIHRGLRTYTRLINRYITPSEFTREKFIKSGISAENIVVKPNFVERDPGRGLHAHGCALFVGRLAPEKGLSILLQAWKCHKNAPLHILGDGVLRKQLETDATSLGLSCIKFIGLLERNEVYKQMKEARVLIFPSQWYETFGMTIIEAYACGLPVIASRLGVMQEIVHDGRTGLHFTPGDADDLARKVEWAWAHPEEMRKMGQNARAEYEANYTAERNYKMLIDVYQQAIVEARQPLMSRDPKVLGVAD